MRLPLTAVVDLFLLPQRVSLNAKHLRGRGGGEKCEIVRHKVLSGGKVDKVHVGQVYVVSGPGGRPNSLGHVAELGVGQGGEAAVGLDHLQRVPQRGPNVLHNFDLVACTEVFHSIVSFQPVSFAVLVEADPDHVEVLAQLGEDLHGFAQHHVQGSTALGEGLVQVLQALQQELHLVELAKLGGWRFPIKYEEREKFCRGVTARSCQTLVVVESKAISEPQNGHPLLLGNNLAFRLSWQWHPECQSTSLRSSNCLSSSFLDEVFACFSHFKYF